MNTLSLSQLAYLRNRYHQRLPRVTKRTACLTCGWTVTVQATNEANYDHTCYSIHLATAMREALAYARAHGFPTTTLRVHSLAHQPQQPQQ